MTDNLILYQKIPILSRKHEERGQKECHGHCPGFPLHTQLTLKEKLFNLLQPHNL